VGPWEHGNERSGVKKGGEFLDHLSDHHLLEKDSWLCTFLLFIRLSLLNLIKFNLNLDPG